MPVNLPIQKATQQSVHLTSGTIPSAVFFWFYIFYITERNLRLSTSFILHPNNVLKRDRI